jgi:uncharacterized protein
MPKSKTSFPDVNVWLAFVAEAHVHHEAAVRWMDGASKGEAAFCRITQMGLLRLLTNRRVMLNAVLTQQEAWRVYLALQRDERTIFLLEPYGLEERWRDLTRRPTPSEPLWMDCYLQAFAECAGLRVVTFDRGFPRTPQSGTLILSG